MLIVAIGLAVTLALYFLIRGRGARITLDVNASAALDAIVADAIERELAQTVLRGATESQRAGLKKTLLGSDADIDIVSRLEVAVKGIDLEFIRFAHEPDAELNVTISYEDGKTTKTTRRIAKDDMPRSVRETFDKNATTRAFLAWQPPWRR